LRASAAQRIGIDTATALMTDERTITKRGAQRTGGTRTKNALGVDPSESGGAIHTAAIQYIPWQHHQFPVIVDVFANPVDKILAPFYAGGGIAGGRGNQDIEA